MSKLIIRPETEDDYRNTETLTREAFWNVYRPGCMEHYVLHCYRNDPAFVPELDLVMVLDGEMIGQVIYVHPEISCFTENPALFRRRRRACAMPTTRRRTISSSGSWNRAS